MRIRLLLPALTLLCSAAIAHASPVTYQLNGQTNSVLNPPNTLTGTVTIDGSAMPTVTSIFITFSDGHTESGVDSQMDGHTFIIGANKDSIQFTDDTHNYPASGGQFTLMDNVYVYPNNDFVGGTSFSGTMTPVSVTPEPSSIALLGTGLLGVAGLIKRRIGGHISA